MTDREHEQLRVDLGAYVLGQLPPAETARLEAHLDGCASCTAELAELTPVAGALATLRGSPDRTAPDEPPAALGDRVVGAVGHAARDERRRGWARAAGIAAVAAAVAVVAALGVQRLVAEDAPAVPTEAVGVVDRAPGVDATAALVAHTWGVEVKLHASGFAPGDRYRVAVLGTDGERYPAGEFVGTGAREMDCNLNSSVLRDRAAGFEVRDDTGRVVVTSTF